MDSKLTLKLDKKIIEKAKSFAKNNNTSLSYLVEGFFERLLEKEQNPSTNASPTVKELVGVLKIKNGSDIELLKEKYLLEKYLHD
jgi:hypothetical protein